LTRSVVNGDDQQGGGGAIPASTAIPGRLLIISRVCGELAVSRAIGDRDFKAAFNAVCEDETLSASTPWEGPNFLPYPEDHNRTFVNDLISGIPEMTTFKLGTGRDRGSGSLPEFLILACDGLWDVMDIEDAIKITSGLLFDKGGDAKAAATRLVELAIQLGSSDNVTVIIVVFSVTVM
jgi:serine/threonine protein phosphatase PrpC